MNRSRDRKSRPFLGAGSATQGLPYCLAFCCQNVQTCHSIAPIGRLTSKYTQCLLFNCCTYPKRCRGNDRSRPSCTNHKVRNIHNTTCKEAYSNRYFIVHTVQIFYVEHNHRRVSTVGWIQQQRACILVTLSLLWDYCISVSMDTRR